MRKILICFVVFTVITGALVVYNNNQPAPLPPPIKELPSKLITINDALEVIDKEEMKRILYWLCSPELEGRMSGKKGNDLARDFLVKYYQNLGLEVNTQEFKIENINNYKEQGSGKTSNIIACLPGLIDETIVVGAHMDHIGYGPAMSQTPQRREIHPGADDNASGTVSLLSIAKALSKMKGKNKRRIVFISFSAEEMGLIGSKYYVNNPKYSNMIFVVNSDMIGRYSTGGLSCFGANRFPRLENNIKSFSQKYGLRTRTTSDLGGGSDHAPFASKGIPTVFCHSGTHNSYHTPDDTPDKIDYDGLYKITKLITETVWNVSENGMDKKKVEYSIPAIFIDHGSKQ